MRDLKIEYQNGKLVELSIDGVDFKTITAITLRHEISEVLPNVTLTFPVGVGKRPVPDACSRENLQIIEK